MRSTRGLGAGGLFLSLLGCADPPVPPTVYVPAADYAQALAIGTGAARAGEWTTLEARLSAGPWRPVPREEADLTDCWWRRPPPPTDSSAASRVTWRVEPADSVRFNLPTSPTAPRQVRFPRPGTYRLWAVAPGCRTPVTSETLTVQVAP